MKISLNEEFSSYIVRKLEICDKVKSFDCGDADLNDFIINEASFYRSAMLAVSYVFENPEDAGHDNIAAYFSLANDRISITDFPDKTSFNRFRKKRFVNKKRLKSYPAVRICRLAVDLSARGQYVGRFLMNFIKSYFVANNKAGCRFLTVDAYKEALKFYEKNGFVAMNSDDENSDTRLLYFDLNDIADSPA